MEIEISQDSTIQGKFLTLNEVFAVFFFSVTILKKVCKLESFCVFHFVACIVNLSFQLLISGKFADMRVCLEPLGIGKPSTSGKRGERSLSRTILTSIRVLLREHK